MGLIAPVPESEASEGVAQIYGRIKEMFGSDDLPAPFLLMGRVEPFLKDFYMNYKKFVHGSGALDAKTRTAIALAVACHAKSNLWIEYYFAMAGQAGWSQQELAEILAVTATNYMYNTFFKFRELSGTQLFDGLPVGLRAHTFSQSSLDHQLIELIDIAISDINACKPCVSGHVNKARDLGLSDMQILEAVQCAAVVYAGAMFINSALA